MLSLTLSLLSALGQLQGPSPGVGCQPPLPESSAAPGLTLTLWVGGASPAPGARLPSLLFLHCREGGRASQIQHSLQFPSPLEKTTPILFWKHLPQMVTESIT